MAGMFRDYDDDHDNNNEGELYGSYDESDITFGPEIGRELCRVKRFGGRNGGYRKDILTDNLTERDKTGLICKVCKGIMKEACISSSGEQFCSYCHYSHSDSKETPDVSVRKMIVTLKCCCPLIERGCKWMGTLENCENHLDTCGYVYGRCKLKCRVVLGRDKLEIHEKEMCPRRKVKCDHCKKDFKSCELNKHLDKCPKVKVSCELKCGEVVYRKDMERHLEHDCGTVRVACQLGCGVKLTRKELEIHVKDTCVQRRIVCKNCFISVQFCDNSKHLKECPKAKVTCNLCSVDKYRKDITDHLKYYCAENEIECPFVKYKCLARIKRKDIDKHLEEKETKHLGLKLTAMEDLITRQSEEIDKQNENTEKQNKEINKLNENIEKQNKEINKLNENSEKQNMEIDRQHREINKRKEEIEREKANTSRQFELLYFITDTIKIIWKIENVTDLMKDNRSLDSQQYEADMYSFRFRFRSSRELSIVFPGTTLKHANPFLSKCHIAFCSECTLNCGIIEVKQRDLTRGCERIITSISKENVDKYSKISALDFPKKDLTLEIFITQQ